MAGLIYYLIVGTWQGIVAIILFFIGLILISSSQMSLHSNLSFSGNNTHSHITKKIVGAFFIIISILIIGIALLLGKQPATSDQYKALIEDAKSIPAIQKNIEAHINNKETLTRMDYYEIQYEIEKIKRRHLHEQLKNQASS